jgi:hypothetical protein
VVSSERGRKYGRFDRDFVVTHLGVRNVSLAVTTVGRRRYALILAGGRR